MKRQITITGVYQRITELEAERDRYREVLERVNGRVRRSRDWWPSYIHLPEYDTHRRLASELEVIGIIIRQALNPQEATQNE